MSSDFSDCIVQGVFLKEGRITGKTLPFPCYTLESSEKKTDSTNPSIAYPDILKMVFEAETIIS